MAAPLGQSLGLGPDSAINDNAQEPRPPSPEICTHAKGILESSKDLPENFHSISKSLASGIKCNYLADLEKAKSRVGELIHNQDVLRESVQQEITNLDEYKLTEDITLFTQDLRVYQAKLLNMKKDIQYVTDKVSKMKKRSVKLQIGKQKEELHKAQQKQKELELQKRLTAKPAAGSFSD